MVLHIGSYNFIVAFLMAKNNGSHTVLEPSVAFQHEQNPLSYPSSFAVVASEVFLGVAIGLAPVYLACNMASKLCPCVSICCGVTS